MPLDFKRLRRDLRRLRRDVDAKGLSDTAEGDPRKKPSGTMAAVRGHLAEIERLKAEGVTWVAIAAALARQGVVLRDGRPITGRHLTGLIDSIRRQDAGRRVARARRSTRTDLVEEATPERRPREHAPSRPTIPPQFEAPEPPAGHLYDMLKGHKP